MNKLSLGADLALALLSAMVYYHVTFPMMFDLYQGFSQVEKQEITH